MTLPMLTLLALSLGASPALADREINHHARVGEALRQGCSIHQVHTPAGKPVQAAPIVRCPEGASMVARADTTRVAANGKTASGSIGAP